MWGQAVEGSARELLADVEPDGDDSEVTGAEQFLRETLADGKLLQKEVERECKNAGYSVATQRRAKKRIGIVSKKDGKTGLWYWSLPAKNPVGAQEKAEGAQGAHTNLMSTLSTLEKNEHLQEILPDDASMVEVEI